MKKFEEYLSETLAAEIKSEPKSNASREARRLGLTYMGFGRYADNKGQIAYIVDNDRLIPFKRQEEVQKMYSKTVTPTVQTKSSKGETQKPDNAKAEANFYSSVLNRRSKQDAAILQQKDKEAVATAKELSKYYTPNNFDEQELNAIASYSNGDYEKVNRYLYKGHDDGISPEEDEYINGIVQSLDSAFEGTQAPFPYTVYAGLSQRYSPDSFQLGGKYMFRGYTSASLNYGTAISGMDEGNVLLQIEVNKGQKALFADSLIGTEDMETLLPRGSKIQVVSGPHALDDSVVSDNPQGNSYAIFHCILSQDL